MSNTSRTFQFMAPRNHREHARFIKKLHHEEKKGGRVISVDVKIYENPSITEIRALVGKKKGACLRALVSESQIWAWPAQDATHDQMKKILVVEGFAEEKDLSGAISAVLSAEADKGIEMRFYPKDLESAVRMESVLKLYHRDPANNLIMEM